jgi:hypothetical protein
MCNEARMTRRRLFGSVAAALAMAIVALPASAKDGGGSGSGGSGSGSGGPGSGSGGSGSGSGGSGSSSGGPGSGNSGPGGGGDDRGGDDHGRDAGGAEPGRDRGGGAGKARGSVVWSRVRGDSAEVRYSDGWSEQVSARRYQLRDPESRVVIERPSKRVDLDRLRRAAPSR